MRDEELENLFSEYLKKNEPPLEEVILAEIEWIRGDSRLGSDHISEVHGITEKEVEDILFAVPPTVRAAKHPDHTGSTLFMGGTPQGRLLFIVCEDRVETGRRILTPITAFVPDRGWHYWKG